MLARSATARLCARSRSWSENDTDLVYPHYESWFPDSIDKIMEWSSITPATRQKLFWDNANRCFKQN